MADESKAIDECRDALETLLKNPERKLVNFLVSEGFMQGSLREDLLNPRSILTGAEKGGKAVDAIYEAVGRDKGLFHKLVAWFRNEKYYQGMAEKLSSKVGGGGGGVSQQHTASGIPPASPVYSSISPPTFEDYARRINPQDLNKEIDRKDTDHQLFEIAEVLRDWERLAPWLGLSEQQIIDIRDHPTRRPQLKRRDALGEWKRTYSFQATYGALLKVCVERGETDCARKIVELLGGSMDGGGAQYTSTPQAAPQGPGAYYSSQPQQQYPQTANHPPHGAEHHQALPPYLTGNGGVAGGYPPQGVGQGAPPTNPPGGGSTVNKQASFGASSPSLQTPSTPTPTTPSSFSLTGSPPTTPIKFPYLADVPEEEKDRLEARLLQESKDMEQKFAILLAKVNSQLEGKKVTVENLKFLLKNSFHKVYKAVKRCKDFSKLMLKLSDYWSFFDYEMLNVIVASHCDKLTPDMRKYEEDFKLYCRRRICEVPEGAIGIKARDRGCLFFKCDDNFSYKKTQLWDVKVLTRRLSVILGSKLVLRSIRKGCIELVLSSLCAMPYPLTDQQKKEVKELGIVQIYSNTREYFSASDLQRETTGNLTYGAIKKPEVDSPLCVQSVAVPTTKWGNTRTLVQYHHIGILMEQLFPIKAQWERIARGLGYHNYEIEGIKTTLLSIMAHGPEGSLAEVLSQWMNWAAGDARGSKDNATLEQLKKAVYLAGFSNVAYGLTLVDSVILDRNQERTLPSPPLTDGMDYFSEDFSPDELHSWLRSNQVPAADCDKIRAGEVGGVLFKILVKSDGWNDYAISKSGMLVLKKHVKRKIVGDSALSNVAIGTPQLPEQSGSLAKDKGLIETTSWTTGILWKIDADGGGDKTIQFEAVDRGLYTPNLKLHDDDHKTTPIPPEPLRVPESDEYYAMKGSKHGVALIINNEHFASPNKDRKCTAREAVAIHWTGLLDWTTGLDYWTENLTTKLHLALV